jgi:hypothetical protein
MAVKKSKTGKGKPGKGTGKKPSPPVVRAALVSIQRVVVCSAASMPACSWLGGVGRHCPLEQQHYAPGAETAAVAGLNVWQLADSRETLVTCHGTRHAQ